MSQEPELSEEQLLLKQARETRSELRRKKMFNQDPVERRNIEYQMKGLDKQIKELEEAGVALPDASKPTPASVTSPAQATTATFANAPAAPTATKVVKILFLAADPSNEARLRLGQEYRDIGETLRLGNNRQNFELLHPALSVRPRDITRALLDHSPQIVHFSGHGSSAGELMFEDASGQALKVEAERIADLFELVSEHVKCVILNACYSQFQAEAIVKHIDYVIGMSDAIPDKAAIAFAIGFYQALGENRTVEQAYKFGRVQIGLEGIPAELIPQLIKKSA